MKQLKGINLGGWLLMEGYFMFSPNKGVHLFKNAFKEKHGEDELKALEKAFMDNFIQEEDFKRIAQLGFNCIRLPFHHQLIEDAPYHYSMQGLLYLTNAVRLAGENGLKVILDLHAAAGSQNHDWHSDSDGNANLWHDEECQKRTCLLWQFLAEQFKDNDAVIGFDILNEAVVEDANQLNQLYKAIIQSIREVNKDDTIFLEGNKWATDLECLADFDDDHLAYSIHNYEPLDFTFNFVPHVKYPLPQWNKDTTKKHLEKHATFAQKHKRDILVGEFGVNYRQGLYGEDVWLKDTLEIFEDYGFHWTYWTYKAIKNFMFPDGIMSYYGNPAWVNRPGPKTGWNTWIECWPKHKEDMIASWRSDKFEDNTKVIEVLTHAV